MIYEGEVEIVSDTGNIVATMKPGMERRDGNWDGDRDGDGDGDIDSASIGFCFGEFGVVADGRVKMMSTFRAKTFCHFLCFTREAMQNALKLFPMQHIEVLRFCKDTLKGRIYSHQDFKPQ